MRPKHLVALLVLLALAVPAAPAHAGGIVSICDEAHLLAALADGGTVTFSCSGTITLTAEITIAADTTIDGSGQTVTISGNHAVRVFQVNPGATLDLSSLTIANGAAGMDERGGGIFNSGTLNLNHSTLTGNRAGGIYGGAGIYNNGGMLTVSNSTFTGNSGGTYTIGGGISNNTGTVTVTNSIFAGNDGGSEGGGIANRLGTLTVSDCIFSANRAATFGGGISNTAGVVTVTNSIFADNYGGYDGGGITNSEGTMTVSSSTFSGNHGGCGGGGAYNYHGPLNLTNSTLSGNSAGYCGSGGGGGIYNLGVLTLSSSTLTSNTTVIGAGGIGAHSAATTILKNTIVANSLAGGNCDAYIIDGGGNLSYPDTTCPGINADPLLGPLQDNGGPTQTHALLPGSAAINAGDPAGCTDHQGNPLNTDQRGFPRFGRCDIGAYELQPIGFSTKIADRSIVFVGDSVGYTITLTNGGVSPISSARVTDTLPASFVYVPGSLTVTGGSPNYDSGVITWEGQIAAGQEVGVSFAARAGTQLGHIANHAVISGGGETFTRTATAEVRLPTYLPLVLR